MKIKTLNDILRLKPTRLKQASPEEIRKVFNQPYSKPTNVIIGSMEFIEKFNEALNEKRN